jgi:tetratricopeptide (TPR) repeat protein
MAQTPTGKIHGHVTDPSGMPKGAGTVSLSTDSGKTAKYSFPVSATGEFTGDGIAPGTYTITFRLPETPADKVVDQIDNVKIEAGEDLKEDVDMSRQAYIDKMSPEQKKQLEEFKKKNAEIMKGNSIIKNLNADLIQARTDIKDKKFDEAEALMTKDTAISPLPPQSETLFFELGNAQMGLKKWDDATTSFKKALELSTTSKKPNPDLVGGAHAAMSEILARTGKAPEAAAEADEAAKINPPKAATYYYNETVIFFQVGNADAQAAAADKAIAADPTKALLYYLKGQALASKITVDSKTGAYILPPGCAEAYNKYLELAPTGPYAAEVKGLLDETHTKVENKYKAKK